MRLPSLLAIVLFVAPTLTYADTVLVGTDLATATHGGAAVLCPSVSNCSDRASQFTFSTPVTIDSISVVVTVPALTPGSTDGSFTIGLGSDLGVGITTGVGADSIFIDPKGDMITETVTFSGLDISLGPGTYYLGMAGGNVEWDYAQPLTGTPGTLGLQLECDPSLTCGSDITRWDQLSQSYAMEIDGTIPTPEPSTLALFGTGLLGLAGLARRRLFHL